jgi:hypothetical protein
MMTHMNGKISTNAHTSSLLELLPNHLSALSHKPASLPFSPFPLLSVHRRQLPL